MSITMMTTEKAYITRNLFGRKIRKVSNYPGHEEGLIRHAKFCPHYNGGKKDTSGEFGPGCRGHHYNRQGPKPTTRGGWNHDGSESDTDYPSHYCDGPMKALFMETTYEGAVLETREKNGYDDSDFYAVVWTGSEIKTITYATTRGWSYPNNATVDATDEVLKAVGDHLEALAEKRYRKAHKNNHFIPTFGKNVRVKSKRSKVPFGTEGEVVWYGDSQYGGGKRVGFRTLDGTRHFCAASCVEVIDELPPVDETEAHRFARSNRENWLGLSVPVSAGFVRI